MIIGTLESGGGIVTMNEKINRGQSGGAESRGKKPDKPPPGGPPKTPPGLDKEKKTKD